VAYLGGHCAMPPLSLMGKFFEGLEDTWKGGWPLRTDLGVRMGECE
jgi:hypothetical protein